ncbi:hypothetical protein Q604_UNBC11440G0002, partial [human gut metagenome]
AVQRLHFNFQQVMYGQTIFQAVDAAGIFCHVAANGTGDL